MTDNGVLSLGTLSFFDFPVLARLRLGEGLLEGGLKGEVLLLTALVLLVRLLSDIGGGVEVECKYCKTISENLSEKRMWKHVQEIGSLKDGFQRIKPGGCARTARFQD
jgi:hypothetical protein